MSVDQWREWNVADIAAPRRWGLNGGPFGSKLVSGMYVPAGVPVIRGCNLPTDRRFNEAALVYVSDEKANELRQHEAVGGDLIITQRGTLGQVGLIPATSAFPRYIVSQSQMKLTVDPLKADPLFVYYVFRSPRTTRRIQDLALTAGVPHINLAILRSFPIMLPELPLQRRIASILGAYDDLIEVNRRRIAILEETARRLFEEWFVHFRFPGYEGVPMTETAEGPLPEGWRVTPLFEVCDRITDGAHNSPPTVPAGRMMASVKDMRDWGFDLKDCREISEKDFGELVRMGCRPEQGDILIAKDGANLNKHTFLVTEEMPLVLLSSIAILRPQSGFELEFLAELLKSEHTSAAIKRMRSGAAIPRVVLRDFKRLNIILPPKSLRQRCEAELAPIHRMCRLLVRTNACLVAARDLLLPRLVSGELSVATAEDQLAAAA